MVEFKLRRGKRLTVRARYGGNAYNGPVRSDRVIARGSNRRG
jgi:hypothetical protein